MRKDGVASLCLLKNKIDRIPYFDIHYSIFDIFFFRVSFSIRLAVFQARGAALMKLHIVGTANRRMSKGGIALLSLFL